VPGEEDADQTLSATAMANTIVTAAAKIPHRLCNMVAIIYPMATK
jgi:hypothetical protein